MKIRNFAWLVPFILLTGIFLGCPDGGGIEEMEFQKPPVPKPVNRDVKVNPDVVAVGKGLTQQFTATITGGGNKSLDWSVSDGTGTTAIDGAGLLVVDEHETAQILIVTAALSGDSAKYGTAVVRIMGNEDAPETKGLTVKPQLVMLGPGDTQTFDAYLSYDGTAASGAAWDTNSENGSAFTGNVLTVDPGEKAENLVVTGRLNDICYGAAIVTVLGNELDPVPVNSGIRVSPQTASVESGKSLNFEAYNSTNNSKISGGVSWQVFGGVSGTKISGGKLDVAADESAAYLTVRAKTANGSYGTAVVEVGGSGGNSGGGSNTVKPDMVQVPGGSFIREGYTITVSAFLIGKYEITQKEWKSAIGSSNNPSWYASDDRPVETVTWYDAVRYCNNLSRRESLDLVYTLSEGNTPTVTADFTKNGYRLPTEAEWEYAARGGQNYSYAGSDYKTEVGQFTSDGTRPVGGKPANGYGLYDMTGNVWEWCWDWYATNYAGKDETDPTGPVSGNIKINRGGAWDRGSYSDSLSYRHSDYPTFNSQHTTGFRVVRRP
jgi:formylglycine-generating enzyme required for sulfatase activity